MSLEILDPAELAELIDNPRKLKVGVSRVKAMNDYLALNTEVSTITWSNMEMQKRANFERYWPMWRNNDRLIANHILLEEGMPQTLSPRQEVVLERFDKRFSTSSSRP